MASDISERIKSIYSSLSKGQKKIATAVINNYDQVAYLTAARLGELCQVSESTVVRFADRLGFEGYSQFQLAVQELVRIKLTPNQRIEITKKRIGEGDVIDTVMESDIGKIKHTMEGLDRKAFSEAVDAILEAKHIYITGARSSEPIARLLSYNLSLIFDNVKLVVPTSSAEVFEQMYSVCADDVVIAFSFPRYSSKMVNGIKFARQKDARVIVFTDSDVSPIAEFANCLLIAQSDMASFMDSLVAPLSIINAIAIEITARREKEITDRFDALEKLWDEYEVYAKH